MTAHVGGITAVSIDSTDNIAKRIPLLIGGVVLLSMLLLVLAFRSIAVAVKAAAMNLLSVAAAYGVVALVLEGGWAGQLVGIDTPTPLPAFVPVLMFAVLFGLSMDYEVFLVSRMREAWLRTRDNERAILEGLAGTGRVITAAAAIMVAVFAAFVPSPGRGAQGDRRRHGRGDLHRRHRGPHAAGAAVMHLLGPANWWMPAWLDRRLPELHIEGHPEAHLPASAPSTPPTATCTDWGSERDLSRSSQRRHLREVAASVLACHRIDIERRVELLLGEVAALDEAHRDHGLADRGAVLERLLGDLGGLLVADRAS